jgi:hypothetical protein
MVVLVVLVVLRRLCSKRHRCWSDPYCWSFVGEGAVRVLDGCVARRLVDVEVDAHQKLQRRERPLQAPAVGADSAGSPAIVMSART